MDEREGLRGEALPPVLFYWRTKVAESFDESARAEVAHFVAGISATMPEWRAAIRGDAAAAVGLVVGRRIPEHIGLRVDLSMTVLLACAFFDPAARWCCRTRWPACRLSRASGRASRPPGRCTRSGSAAAVPVRASPTRRPA
jgi:hypothetical protein